MSKVVKVKSWKDIVNMPKTASCDIPFKNGDIYEFQIKGLTQTEIGDINDYYDKKMPQKPVKCVNPKNGSKSFTIDITEGEDYEKYKEEEKRISNLRAGVLAISFLPDEYRPDVDVNLTGYDKLEAQAILLSNEVVGGALSKIIEYGLEVSGYGVKFDEQVETAKNS
jgi:hypothetical protein